MTKEEWVAWKNYELTQKKFQQWKDFVEIMRDEWEKGNLANNDAFNRGFVAGIRFTMEPTKEEMEEENEE